MYILFSSWCLHGYVRNLFLGNSLISNRMLCFLAGNILLNISIYLFWVSWNVLVLYNIINYPFHSFFSILFLVITKTLKNLICQWTVYELPVGPMFCSPKPSTAPANALHKQSYVHMYVYVCVYVYNIYLAEWNKQFNLIINKY